MLAFCIEVNSNFMFKIKYKPPTKPSPPKPELIQYNDPPVADMAIILVYFNPCKYRRIIQNALTVKHLLDYAQIPYFIAEIKHDSDTNHLFCKSDNVFQYSSNSYLFYKENLIRIVETKLPDNFTKLCILDFDIFFDNPDWYSVVSEKLNSVQVVQPFTKAHFLNIDYSVHEVKTNCVDKKTRDPIDYATEHTGFVWAFTREWYRAYNFDDMFISAGGDTIFANNITKRSFTDLGSRFYYKYRLDAKLHTEDVSYDSCDLNVYHLNHGPLVNRQYVNINYNIDLVFQKNNIDSIETLMIRREDGILEYHEKYIELFNSVMLAYFKIRDDDKETKVSL